MWVCGLHDGRTERNYSARTTSRANEYWCASPVRLARGQCISIINTLEHRIARFDTTKEKIRSGFTRHSFSSWPNTWPTVTLLVQFLLFTYFSVRQSSLKLLIYLIISFRSVNSYSRAGKVRKTTEVKFAKAVHFGPFIWYIFFFTILMRSAIVPLDNLLSRKNEYPASMLKNRKGKYAVSAILAFYRSPLRSTSRLFVSSPQLTFLERRLPVLKRLSEEKRPLRAFLESLQEFCRYFSSKRLSRFSQIFFCGEESIWYTVKFHSAMNLYRCINEYIHFWIFMKNLIIDF